MHRKCPLDINTFIAAPRRFFLKGWFVDRLTWLNFETEWTKHETCIPTFKRSVIIEYRDRAARGTKYRGCARRSPRGCPWIKTAPDLKLPTRLHYELEFCSAEANAVLQKRVLYCGRESFTTGGNLYYRREFCITQEKSLYYKQEFCTTEDNPVLQKRIMYYKRE